jgi:integrase/recombinase XerD
VPSGRTRVGLDKRACVYGSADQLQSREGHGVIVNLVGKGKRLRTVASRCMAPAFGSERRKSIQACFDGGNAARSWRDSQRSLVRGETVRPASRHKQFGPHDLRRTCVRLCHRCGRRLEQIQFLLGHAPVQTTERYIGSKQKLQDAVNDRLGISVASDAA